MMKSLVMKAVESVLKAEKSFCKFLSANDSGETGENQSGILISKSAKAMLFTEQEMKNNHILKKSGCIKWQDDYTTDCTFTWYKSKNELRITGFGRGKSPLVPELTGALFVMAQNSPEDYFCYIFNTDEEIQEFLGSFGLTPAETNCPIEVNRVKTEIKEQQAIENFITGLTVDFPSSVEMASAARMIQNEVYHNQGLALTDPDSILLRWTDEEYSLFRSLEHFRYGNIISKGFQSVDDFVVMANQVLNRRKSRAGKSLEHHISTIFDENKIQYTSQARTERGKTVDFMFPSEEAYHDVTFSINKICTLAAKTTCKDRWRQILSEANRLRDKHKYLCTLQQGISATQMDEMQDEKVILVIPKPYIKYYPKDRQNRIWTLGKFVSYVKEMEGIS